MKEGWEIKKLGEVLQKTETINPLLKPEEEFIYIDISSVDNQKYIIESPTRIKGKDAPSRARKLVKENDVIFATVRPTLKRIAIITSEFDKEVCSTGYFVLRANNLINYKLIYYFLQTDSFILSIEKLQKGASYPAVTDGDVRQQIITIPKSLSEQQRIVQILDGAFEKIDTLKDNAERNLQFSKELFESYLRSILSKKWPISTLGSVCERVEYGSSTKSTIEGEIAVLRMGNIQRGKFNWDKLVYSDNAEDNKKYILKYNDVLFNRTNSPELVGKTAIYKGEMPAIFAGYLIRIHRLESILDADYLNYYLNSEMAMNYGKSVVISSVNQANINGTKLKSYPIPLPSLKEQQTIVKHLDALSAHCKELEANYQKTIAQCDEMKKAVLGKAFSGEL
jgi:type I restriction enzyme S subunit